MKRRACATVDMAGLGVVLRSAWFATDAGFTRAVCFSKRIGWFAEALGWFGCCLPLPFVLKARAGSLANLPKATCLSPLRLDTFSGVLVKGSQKGHRPFWGVHVLLQDKPVPVKPNITKRVWGKLSVLEEDRTCWLQSIKSVLLWRPQALTVFLVEMSSARADSSLNILCLSWLLRNGSTRVPPSPIGSHI